ncbi:hypothetical protein Csa_001143 [Cucumis sativus]|nr:hypothetical protein Csa_001143 [Cucumis sativus]
MSAVCTTKFCISDARSVRTPRAVYINLNNWTESENEIVKSAIPKARRRVQVVDGVSCRQMVLSCAATIDVVEQSCGRN